MGGVPARRDAAQPLTANGFKCLRLALFSVLDKVKTAFLSQKGGIWLVWYFKMGSFGSFIFSRKRVYDTRLALAHAGNR